MLNQTERQRYSNAQISEQFASGSFDKTIRIWSEADKKGIKSLFGHKGAVKKVAFSFSDILLISAGFDDQLLIWDLTGDTILRKFDIKHTSFSISSADILAYTDTLCNLVLFDLKSLKEKNRFGNFCDPPFFHPHEDTVVLHGQYKSDFKFIDTKSGDSFAHLDIKKENNSSIVSVFRFTPDGLFLVAGISGGEIEVWDWYGKRLTRTMSGNTLSGVDDLAFNEKDELLSASGDGSVKLWNWKNGRLKMIIGDGLFRAKLSGLFSVIIVLTLFSGFAAIAMNGKKRFSAFALLSILTAWSAGLFLILYYLRSSMSRFSSGIAWTMTVLSGLLFLSVWFSPYTFFTIPIALFFCYIKILDNRYHREIYFPLLINLIFSGVFCSFILSSGLAR